MNKDLIEFLKKIKCLDNIDKIEIINFLLDSPESAIETISKKLNIKPSTVYKYLQEMNKAGIINKKNMKESKEKDLYSISEISIEINNKKIKEFLDKKNSSLGLIIFDVDDTLIERKDIPEELSKIGKNAINEAKIIYQEKGFPINLPPKELFEKKWILEKYGNTVDWYISTWLNVSGAPNDENKDYLVKKYTLEYFKNIEVTSQNCQLFKDVKLFLEKLKNRYYFAAFSNSSKKTVVENFKLNNIYDYFIKDGIVLIIGGDEIPKSKETIDKILKLSNIPVKDVLLVGDTGKDIKVGRDAGIPFDKTVVISRGLIPLENIRIIKPKVRIIKSFNELIE